MIMQFSFYFVVSFLHLLYLFYLDESEDVLTAGEVLKWMVGMPTIPPLGLPKKISVTFVHGCDSQCQCRPSVSTCDTSLLVKIPIHIHNEEQMYSTMLSAIRDSVGFGCL